MSVTSLPTLASTWTAPTSCFASTNYYYVLLGSGYFSNMYGTPTPVLTGNAPTGTCFPPSFTIDVPYLTDGGCPSGYTLACASAATGSASQYGSMMTCCPSVTSDVFSWMCKDDQYGCHATATAGVVWTGVETNIGIAVPTEEPITRTPSTAEGIEAWGIKFLSVPKVASSTTAPTQAATLVSSTTSTPESSPDNTLSQASSTNSAVTTHSSGLSAGPIVGIAIGSATGAILLATGSFLWYRRKRHQNNAAPPHPPSPVLKEEYKVNPRDMPYQLDGEGVIPPRNRIVELQG